MYFFFIFQVVYYIRGEIRLATANLNPNRYRKTREKFNTSLQPWRWPPRGNAKVAIAKDRSRTS
ncbi:unnamed protein product [Linum tenue]|uniref:Uncharacterized protein n=1 Tax=Linum tenue TaxID=586396 RepID=A0AAV0NT41_9ROSI|nr:unnamed protein product [Linum tenue]